MINSAQLSFIFPAPTPNVALTASAPRRPEAMANGAGSALISRTALRRVSTFNRLRNFSAKANAEAPMADRFATPVSYHPAGKLARWRPQQRPCQKMLSPAAEVWVCRLSLSAGTLAVLKHYDRPDESTTLRKASQRGYRSTIGEAGARVI